MTIKCEWTENGQEISQTIKSGLAAAKFALLDSSAPCTVIAGPHGAEATLAAAVEFLELFLSIKIVCYETLIRQ